VYLCASSWILIRGEQIRASFFVACDISRVRVDKLLIGYKIWLRVRRLMQFLNAEVIVTRKMERESKHPRLKSRIRKERAIRE